MTIIDTLVAGVVLGLFCFFIVLLADCIARQFFDDWN